MYNCTIYIICKFQHMYGIHYVTFYILYNMGFVGASVCVCMNACGWVSDTRPPTRIHVQAYMCVCVCVSVGV